MAHDLLNRICDTFISIADSLKTTPIRVKITSWLMTRKVK
jgi:hypothetical protein